MEPMPDPAARARGRWRWMVAAVVLVVAGVAAWWIFLRVELGTEVRRVTSPTGEHEVVVYEFSTMMDLGWNLAVVRTSGGGREWFWRSVEGPAPREIRFTGPTSVEVVDDAGEVYRVRFDPETLEPSERYCLRPEYCHSRPWDRYTRDRP